MEFGQCNFINQHHTLRWFYELLFPIYKWIYWIKLRTSSCVAWPTEKAMAQSTDLWSRRLLAKIVIMLLWNSASITYNGYVQVFRPLLLKNKGTGKFTSDRMWECWNRRWSKKATFICPLGNADVRSVSWVSSTGFFFGTLKMNAAWSNVAAVAVMRYP